VPWPTGNAGGRRWAGPPAPTSDLGHPADIARGTAAMAAGVGGIQWIDTDPPRGSVALLPALPHQDAIMLALLVASGQMTWPEINAALDAKVKLATVDKLDRHRQQHGATPPSWRHEDAWAAHRAWHEARRTGEREIWARYNAKCDAVFANAPAPSGARARAHDDLLNREQVLDVFRMARDDEFAELTQRLGPQPSRPATFPARPMPVQSAMVRCRLSAEETDAIDKLDEAGFTASAGMRDIIEDLAREIADEIANAT